MRHARKRLGLRIHWNGAQPEQPETRVGQQLAPLVGVEQGAVFEVELAADTAGHEVLHTVQHLDPRRARPRIGQPDAPDEAEALAIKPGVTKRQAQILVDFLEDQLVAPDDGILDFQQLADVGLRQHHAGDSVGGSMRSMRLRPSR